MTQYVPGQSGDIALVQWYTQLAASGDLQRLVGPSLYPMGAFLAHFTSPACVLWYEEDENGWWAVATTFPLMGGGSWGLWVRSSCRAMGYAKRALQLIMCSLAISLSAYPVLVNVTKDRAVVDKTCRLGYTYLGEIPFLFEGDSAHVLYMTREAFMPRWVAWSEKNGEPGR